MTLICSIKVSFAIESNVKRKPQTIWYACRNKFDTNLKLCYSKWMKTGTMVLATATAVISDCRGNLLG